MLLPLSRSGGASLLTDEDVAAFELSGSCLVTIHNTHIRFIIALVLIKVVGSNQRLRLT